MEVKNPQRIMFLGGPVSGVLSLLNGMRINFPPSIPTILAHSHGRDNLDLTGSAPDPRLLPATLSAPPKVLSDEATTSHPSRNPQSIREEAEVEPPIRTTTAGLTHTLSLKTKYYNASIPVWLDEAGDPFEWRHDFLSPEAAQVVKAVGAWIIVLRKGHKSIANDVKLKPREHAKCLMETVKEVVERAHVGDNVWDGILLVVEMPCAPFTGDAEEARMANEVEEETQLELGEDIEDEEWEDTCLDLGFEYVACPYVRNGQARSSSGGGEGITRIREALEANDWESVDEEDIEIGCPESTGFDLEQAQMEQEFAGLKMAMSGGHPANDAESDQEFQVDEMERIMGKMVTVRGIAISSHTGPNS